jgi:ethanolamine utilization protein EutN
MIIGKVVGSVVSTRKNENLVGNKLLIVEPLEGMIGAGQQFVAIDNVGAGIDEIVLVAFGSAARIGCEKDGQPIDAAIVGIVDNGG